MGRHQKNPVRKYFVYDGTTKKSTCKAEEGCNVKIQGNHAGNMQRHIHSCHKELYDQIFAEDSARKDLNTLCSESHVPNKKPRLQKQSTLDNIIKKVQHKVSVNINSAILKRACTELVTVNGRPFSLFADSGFRSIVDPILQALEPNLTINPENVKKDVVAVAADIRGKIKQELKGKLLSLKVDVATRLDRSILGINAQIVENDKLVLRTLAMREMKQKHEASYIASIIINVLTEYDISLKQIFSITTDNGANMVKAVSILSDTQNYENIILIDDEDDASVQDLVEDREKDDNKSSEELEDLDFEKLQSNLHLATNKIIVDTRVNNILRNIRCAAHTVALSVNDALKDKIVSGLISTARFVCKKLRTTSVLTIIKRMKLLKPILDCPTRWNSTHDMLERLLALKSFCQDMAPTIKELHITESNWNAIDNIVRALKPAKISTKIFQDKQLLAGDFYCSWLTCKNETKKINTPFARNLLNFMNEREQILLNNDAFAAAIFLDPRYKIILTETQIEGAKIYINQAWCILTRLNDTFENIENSHLDSASPSTTSQSSKEEDDIETFLKQREKNLNLSNNTNKNTECVKNIHSLLDAYAAEPREKRDCNVLEFWNNKKAKENSMKELCNIATSILSLPMTQVSVERAFSALKYILSCQRSNLNAQLLEDILLVRLNKDLF